uniref:Uncharacterized protein n=1 Tax=Mycena chlorophos TaxID=658473 RepID=A0ABQ0LK13_MYCCL|nr:predicted protein [Mycena chlorophos]
MDYRASAQSGRQEANDAPGVALRSSLLDDAWVAARSRFVEMEIFRDKSQPAVQAGYHYIILDGGGLGAERKEIKLELVLRSETTQVVDELLELVKKFPREKGVGAVPVVGVELNARYPEVHQRLIELAQMEKNEFY